VTTLLPSITKLDDVQRFELRIEFLGSVTRRINNFWEHTAAFCYCSHSMLQFVPFQSISTCSKSRFNAFSGFRHFNIHTAGFLYLKRGFTATLVSSSILRTYKGYPNCRRKKKWFTSSVYFEKFRADIAPLEERCQNPKKNIHFELCPQEVCMRPYLPSWIATHVYFLKCPREGRSVVLLMRLHRSGQWFFLSPEKLYFSKCDSVLTGVRYVNATSWCVCLCLYIYGLFQFTVDLTFSCVISLQIREFNVLLSNICLPSLQQPVRIEGQWAHVVAQLVDALCYKTNERSRVRFPIVSLEFFIDIIIPAALLPCGWLSL
jgi:hypothetical protein